MGVRILHVLDHSLPLHSGYTFRTRAIVTAQKARGLEVACLTGVRHERAGPNPEHTEGTAFLRPLTLPTEPHPTLPRRGAARPPGPRRGRRRLRRAPPAPRAVAAARMARDPGAVAAPRRAGRD